MFEDSAFAVPDIAPVDELSDTPVGNAPADIEYEIVSSGSLEVPPHAVVIFDTFLPASDKEPSEPVADVNEKAGV